MLKTFSSDSPQYLLFCIMIIEYKELSINLGLSQAYEAISNINIVFIPYLVSMIFYSLYKQVQFCKL